jgi:tetratricopeptide (TPR) repeat protein
LVRAYTCEQIADELMRNLDFLATSMRNVPPRHRTLRAVFEQSWTLLTPHEQEAFCRLAVFTGSFAPPAAQEVAGVEQTLLTALVDHSLLQVARIDGDAGSAERLLRYNLHPALSPYADEKLSADSAKEDDLRARHCVYFSHLMQAQAQTLKGAQVLQGLRAVTADLDNIRAAWRYAVAAAEPAWLAMAVTGLVQYYLLRGPLAELQAMLASAVAAMRAQMAETAVGEQQQRAPSGRGVLSLLLAELAGSYNELGQYEQAIATAREAIDLAQRYRQTLSEVQGYLQCGRALYFLSRFDEAMPALNTALALARTAQADSLCAAAHHTLGTVRLYRGEYDGGQAHYEEAMRLFQSLGEEQNELKVRYSLAVVLFFSGDYSAAQAIYGDCLQRYRAIGDQRSSGLLLNNLGAVYAQLGDFVQAENNYAEALTLKRAIGDRPLESLILANIGQVANNRGDYEKALNYCRAALSIGRELGERATIAYAQTCLGYALAGLGWHAEAVEIFGEAIALRRMLGQEGLALEPLAGLVSVHLALGNASHAQTYVESALPHLKGLVTSGVVEPFRVYLAFYRVLQANHDVRGLEVLQSAYDLLQKRAAGISDETQRRSYLTNVPTHREIVAEFEKTPEARAAAGPQQWRRRIEQHSDLTRAVEDLLRPDNAPSQSSEGGAE